MYACSATATHPVPLRECPSRPRRGRISNTHQPTVGSSHNSTHEALIQPRLVGRYKKNETNSPHTSIPTFRQTNAHTFTPTGHVARHGAEAQPQHFFTECTVPRNKITTVATARRTADSPSTSGERALASAGAPCPAAEPREKERKSPDLWKALEEG